MLKSILERFPLILIFTSYMIGIILDKYCAITLGYWWVILFVIFFIELSLPERFKSFLTVMLILLLLGGMNHSKKVEIPQNHLSNIIVDDKPDSIRAMVEQSERRSNGSLKVRLKKLQVKREKWLPYKGKLLLTVKDSDKNFMYGDLVEFRAKIYQPAEKRNPGEFDYKKYLLNHGIYAVAYLKQVDIPTIVGKAGFPVRRFANKVKVKIQELIDRSMTGEQNAILKALIVGVRGEISDETRQAFVDSGIIHVLAVSGLHVGYVTLVFLVIFGFFRFPRKIKMILTIIVLCFYALMVDLRPSVTRAVIMASLVLISQGWEKRVNIYNTLAAAALIQTIIDPLQIFDMGFQLSFIAVFSIVYIYKRIEKLLPERFNPDLIQNVILKRGIQLFLVSLSALLGTLPITVFYFYRVPLISLIANLFVIPLVGLIGALGFAQVILGFIWGGINLAYGEVQMILIGVLRWMIKIASQFPFAYLQVAGISTIGLFIWYALLFGVLNFDKNRVRIATIVGVLLLMNIWVWGKVVEKHELQITFFNVGQGDAALVEFPSGKKMLVDTGDRTFRRDYGKLVIAPYLKRNCISHVDIMALSHPHNDHIGGAPYLLRNFSFGEIWETDLKARSGTYHRIHFLADSLGIPIRKLYAGDYLAVDKFTKIYVVHPSPSFLATKPKGYNDYSTTFKLTHDDIDVLFTGDVEDIAENYIALWGDFLASEVLKVPHHGSRTSSTFPFIKYVQPEYALISVGQRNKFNHPSMVTITKYDSLKTKIHRTDLNGAFVIKSDGKRVKICSW